MLVYLAADEARLEELDTATRDYLGWTHVLANEADLDLTQNQKNQAAQRQAQADQTVTVSAAADLHVGARPGPAGPERAVRDPGDQGRGPVRVAGRAGLARLGNDGDLSTRQAAATIRLAINKVPQIWKDGHVSARCAVGALRQYPYMPRLRDRRVLNEGIVDLPMIWQTDAFALATGYDEAAGRYVGLWTPDDKGAAPAATDSLLLVRPDVAAKQRDAELPAARTPIAAERGSRRAEHIEPDPDQPGVVSPQAQDPLLRRQDPQLRQDRAGLQEHRRRDHRQPPRGWHRALVKIEIEATKPPASRRQGPHRLRERPDPQVRPVGLRRNPIADFLGAVGEVDVSGQGGRVLGAGSLACSPTGQVNGCEDLLSNRSAPMVHMHTAGSAMGAARRGEALADSVTVPPKLSVTCGNALCQQVLSTAYSVRIEGSGARVTTCCRPGTSRRLARPPNWSVLSIRPRALALVT